MALVAVSAEAPAITTQLADWFSRSEPPLRTSLGLALALGFHGLADEAVERIISDEAGHSIRWVVRSGGLIAYRPGQSGSPRPEEEPYISSPVPGAIHLAKLVRARAEEQTIDFSPIRGFLSTLMESSGELIDYPR